jgi:hypothetical protein
VPINRLDRQLVCKVCGAQFYLDPCGANLVLGERPKDLLASHQHHIRYGKVKKLWVERLEEKWRALPRKTRTAVKSGLAGVAALIVLLMILVPALRPRPKFPKDLNQRAVLVATAFIRGDRDRLAALTEPSSRRYLDEWLEKARPPEWGKSHPLLQIATTILSNNPRSSRATVSVSLSEPQAPPPPPEMEAEGAGEPAGEVSAPAPGGEQESAKGDPGEPTKQELQAAPPEPPPADVVPGQGNLGDPGTVPAEPAVMAGDQAPAGAQPGTADAEVPAPPVEPPPMAPAPKPAKKVLLTLYWIKLDDNEWLLDLVETLKYAF